MQANIIPTIRYRNAANMIQWLCATFSFEQHLLVQDEQGGIVHAQLTLGNGMIMVGDVRDDAFGRLQTCALATQPVTQSPYIVVPDADDIYRRAQAGGAEIVMEIVDNDYGGRGFSCRDPEGQLWNFGSYDPWSEKVS